MTIAAIPTTYAGVNFRSRLEARWAAMFDLLNWPWEYEPIDLNGYIPDFILKFENPLLVEVKPFINLEIARGPNWIHPDDQSKIMKSGWNHEAWIVGATISTYEESAYAGALWDPHWASGAWWPAQIEYIDNPGHWSPHAAEGGWGCRVHKNCGRKIYGSFYSHPDKRQEIIKYWREAGNKVQWKAPKPQRTKEEAAAADIRLRESFMRRLRGDK